MTIITLPVTLTVTGYSSRCSYHSYRYSCSDNYRKLLPLAVILTVAGSSHHHLLLLPLPTTLTVTDCSYRYMLLVPLSNTLTVIDHSYPLYS